VKVTLVDTMGFPDPDPRMAAPFYDAVVTEAVNAPQGLNALVWVLKSERQQNELYALYAAFLRELAQAECRLMLVVNGMENYAMLKRKGKEQQLENQRAIDQKNMQESGQKVIDFIGLANMSGVNGLKRDIPIIASTDMDWLCDEMPSWLMAYLDNTKCEKSKVMTFQEMDLAYKDADAARETQEKQAAANQAKFLKELQQMKERCLAVRLAAQSQEQQKEQARKDREKAMQQVAASKSQVEVIKEDKAKATRRREAEIDHLATEIAALHASAATAALAGGVAAWFTFGISAAAGAATAATLTAAAQIKQSEFTAGSRAEKEKEAFDENKRAEEEKIRKAEMDAKQYEFQARQAESRAKQAELEAKSVEEKARAEEERRKAEEAREKARLATLHAEVDNFRSRFDNLNKYLRGEN